MIHIITPNPTYNDIDTKQFSAIIKCMLHPYIQQTLADLGHRQHHVFCTTLDDDSITCIVNNTLVSFLILDNDSSAS
jgi:hypothetical protein